MRKTKIICTIGPSVSDLAMIERLIGCGMDVARLNFSHGNHDMHREVIDRIKYARKKADKPVAILLDTKGPEIRVGKFVNGSIHVKKDQAIRIAKSEVIGDDSIFSIHPLQVLEGVYVGTQILFDDGYISSHITSIDAETITISFDNEGELKNNKGVNIPNCKLNLPNVPEKDFEDIRFGCEHGIDLIAASFVRSPEAILEIKNFLRSINSENTLVLAKIENHEGVENFDGIIQIADGVMIARGDLGVEVPISQVPNLQKMMIRKSNLYGKLSVTATQ
ncbi:MAG: pyruvate kinase, partial [Chlamydiia bacterium]|nr:pyruvate kinase [Chlamydiia bacterium]